MKWAFDEAKKKPGKQVFVKKFPGIFVKSRGRNKLIVWHFRYKGLDGRYTSTKIGIHPECDFKQAKKRATDIIRKLENGIDPKLNYSSRGEIKFNQYWDDVKDVLYPGDKRWDIEARRIYERNLRVFGNIPIGDIRPSTVNKHIQYHVKAGRRTTANHLLAIIRKILKSALLDDIIDSNPADHVNYVKVKSRTKLLKPDKLKDIFDYCSDYLASGHKVSRRAALFVLTVMFTGCRHSQLQGIEYEDIDVYTTEDGTKYGILSADGKSTERTGEEEVVIFPEYILNLYEEYPDYLPFNMRAPRRFWDRIRDELKLGDIWLRDLRRSYASLAYNSGINLDLLGELLNHKNKNTTAIYAKLANDARVQASIAVSREFERKVMPE